MTGLRVVCDENIVITPALRALAAELVTLPGRAIDASAVAAADILLVRSVTPVTAELVAASPVRFVGSATAGTDHLDTAALAECRIAWAAAPGSNATAVSDYVLAALVELDLGRALQDGLAVGVVGLGAVGTRVAGMLSALGARVSGYDPLCSHWPQGVRPASLEQILASPVVTLHAALHDRPVHPSRGLIDAAEAELMHPGAVLINAGRGGLVTPVALETALSRSVRLVLDTWPEEPRIGADLLAATRLATPHIAGYSIEARSRATDCLVAAIHRAGLSATPPQAAPDPTAAAILAPDWVHGHHTALERIVRASYDIAEDDAALRAVASSQGVAGADFDHLRKHYPLRRELRGQRVAIPEPDPNIVALCTALGISPHTGE